jgi:septal ring factor EnvC (AmiA/AmiB activator)
MAMEGVLADGTVVATPNESFEVGAELYVIDAEGNPQPAPDGEHTLDNGMVLVSVGGFITEVTEVEIAEEEMSADIAATIAAMDEQLTSIKNQLAEKETELASVRAELSEVKNNLNVSQAKATELSKQAAAVSVKEEKAVVETAVNFSKKQTKNDTILKTIMSLKK